MIYQRIEDLEIALKKAGKMEIKNKWLTMVCTVTIILALMTFTAGCFGHDDWNDGYDEGFRVGSEDSTNDEPFDDTPPSGHSDDWEDGYKDGYSDGYYD